jgi:hypothetical protein
VENEDWLIELEISLIKAFGWSLWDIDNTDIESLLPLVVHFGDSKAVARKVYCDQLDGW